MLVRQIEEGGSRVSAPKAESLGHSVLTQAVGGAGYRPLE